MTAKHRKRDFSKQEAARRRTIWRNDRLYRQLQKEAGLANERRPSNPVRAIESTSSTAGPCLVLSSRKKSLYLQTFSET
jgi:hypothetical protein